MTGYYIGNSAFYTARYVHAWLAPLLTWGAFLLVVAMMMLCLSVLVRRQWTERERLSYPVIQLPIEMARPDGFQRLVGNRLFQMGAGLTMAVELMNCFSAFYPSVPRVNLGLINVGQLFVEPPWNALATWPPLFIGWLPFAVGISFFLPLDLAFSSWVFFLVRRAEDVLAVAWGWRDPGASVGQMRFPFVREQASGAWIALFFLTFWVGRRAYLQVIRAALGRRTTTDDRRRTTDHGPPTTDHRRSQAEEVTAYRWALAGLVLGGAFLLAFSVVSGMALWVAAVYFGIYFMLIVTMTRIRAQLGPPMLELFFVNPEQIFVAFVGTTHLSPASMTVLAYYFWFNRCYRCQPMAHQLEAFRLAEATGLARGALARWMAITVTVGVVVGLLAVMHVYYDAGETSAKILTYRTGVGRETFNRLEDWLRNPRGPDTVGLWWMAGGGAFTFLLAAMQSRFLWWPLHPIGYAFSTCYAMEYWWSTIATTWLIKLLLVRYGGLQTYVKARPLFLGLILGDALVAVGLALLSWIFGWHGVGRF